MSTLSFAPSDLHYFLEHFLFHFLLCMYNVFLNVLFDSVSLNYGQYHHHHHIDETVEYLLPHLQPYRPNSISLMPAPQARRLGLIGMYVCMYVYIYTCHGASGSYKHENCRGSPVFKQEYSYRKSAQQGKAFQFASSLRLSSGSM